MSVQFEGCVHVRVYVCGCTYSGEQIGEHLFNQLPFSSKRRNKTNLQHCYFWLSPNRTQRAELKVLSTFCDLKALYHSKFGIKRSLTHVKMYAVFVINFMLMPTCYLWYFISLFGTVIFQKRNLGLSKVIFFSPYFLTFWDKLMFGSFHTDLAICSPYEHVGYIRSKWQQTLWFSTIRSLRKLRGLVGNSPVHQFCTVTDFLLEFLQAVLLAWLHLLAADDPVSLLWH